MKRKLGEICRIVSGSTPKTGIPEYWDGNLKWITPAELDDKSRTVNDTKRTITELGAIKTGLTPLPAGTVLLSSRAPIGKVAITGCEMYCNQGFKNLICSDLINNEYLYWFLKGKTQCLKSLGRGATFKEISKTIVADIEINLPDIEEQEKIVNCIKKIDSRLFMLRAEISRLDELIKARFVEMFGDVYKTSKYPKQKWNNIVTIKNGKDYKKVAVNKGGYPVYGTGGEIARTSEFLCPENTIIVGRKGTINNPLLVREKFWNVDTAFGVIPSDKLHYLYFFWFCKMFDFSRLNKQAVLPSTTKADLLNIEMQVPPIEIQNKFATFVAQVDKSKFALQNNIISLMNLWYNINQYVCERTYGEA